MGTVNDAFQSLDYLDQRRHVGDLIEGWGLQLCQEGADPLLGHAIKDSFHPAQTARCGLQHVEDLLLLLGVPNQVGLVGVAILAQLLFSNSCSAADQGTRTRFGHQRRQASLGLCKFLSGLICQLT